MTGFKVMGVYFIAYLSVLFVIDISEQFNLLLDIPFLVCISINLLLISWIALSLKHYSTPSIILLVSLLLSSALIISQYIMLIWATDLVYNQSNAIISRILPILTLIDVLSMIWITLDGLFNKSRPNGDEHYTSGNIVNANCDAGKQNCGGGC